MGLPAIASPLTPPHRKSYWTVERAEANDNPEKELEAMLPKDVLRYAEKVKNVEEAVVRELKKKNDLERDIQRQLNDPMSPHYRADSLLRGIAPGAILRGHPSEAASQAALFQAQAQLRQNWPLYEDITP
jgi:hypothetical protein